MDEELIERLIAIQLTLSPLSETGARNVVIELLKALHEPTEKMIAAGMDGDSLELGSSAYGCWQDMIDAIVGKE